MTPEERARQQIDLLLGQSGWIVQDRSGINLSAGPGIAISEAGLKAGEADISGDLGSMNPTLRFRLSKGKK